MDLDYVITNHSRKIFIRLGDGGTPETCSKNQCQYFTQKKAKNVLKSLPKTMKKFHFMAIKMPLSFDQDKCDQQKSFKNTYHESDHEDKNNIKCKTFKKEYAVPIEVETWLEKMKSCNGLAKEALCRKNELMCQLSNVDRELSNCLHEIELCKNMNACDGYKEYRRIKIILEKRRVIKDELIVVKSILSSNLQSIGSDRIQKVIDGLGNRKFTIRDVDLDEIYIEGD